MIKKPPTESSITSACCTLVPIIGEYIHTCIYIVVEYQTYFVQGLKTGGTWEVYQELVICFDLENCA